MEGEVRGSLFLEQFLKHFKLPPKYFPLALKSKIICLTDCTPHLQSSRYSEEDVNEVLWGDLSHVPEPLLCHSTWDQPFIQMSLYSHTVFL